MHGHHYNNIRIPSEPMLEHDLEMDFISDTNTSPWVWRMLEGRTFDIFRIHTHLDYDCHFMAQNSLEI